MSDNAPELAEVPAPEMDATAAPEPVDTSTPEEQPVEQEASKTFTQEELDAIVGKRLAREQRKWEREQAQRLSEQQARQQPADLVPEQFETYEDYADALAERKAQQLLARREAEQQQRALVEAYHEREEAVRDKYDDFEMVAYNPELPVTEVMARAIQASEIGPEVLYHLGTNPKEAARIARLDPILQAREIGKIEVQLGAAPPVKRTSNAPAPIDPVTPRASGAPVFDTTDPRSVKSMSTSEWIEAERQRQIKKYEAQRNR
jgi:hypothetical protein